MTVWDTIYGCAFQAAGGLANLEIGLHTGRKISIRFVAEQSAVLTGVVLYMKTDPGYSLGTGGTVKVALQNDDGTSDHFPAGIDLDSVSAAPGNPASPTFRTFTFSGGVSLVLGNFYHLVLTNTDAAPASNYVSLDDLGCSTNTASPYYSGNPIVLNSSAATSWDNFGIVWQNTGPPWVLKTNHIPICSIKYAGGQTQGQGYIDELAGSGLFTIQGANQAGVVFTPTGTARTVTAVNIWIIKVGSPGALTVDLQTSAGVSIESGTISAASVSSSAFSWVTFTFASSHTLALSTAYRLVLSAASDAVNNYQVFPLQDGVSNGLTVPSEFSDGHYQNNTGGGWTNPSSHTDYDLPLFFNVSVSGGISAVRITQLPVETSIQPSTGKVRVTQLPVETSIQPSTGKVRVTQLLVETSITYIATPKRQPQTAVCC